MSRDQRFFDPIDAKPKCGPLVRLTLIPASAGKFPELCYLKEQAAPVTVGSHAEIFFHLLAMFPLVTSSAMKEAKNHGNFIAHRIGTEKPSMVREGNYISVTNGQGDEIFQIPLASTTI